MVTFAPEKFKDCWQEMSAIWPKHWEEVALDKDKIQLNMAVDAYLKLGENGLFHMIVARDNGKIVGYHGFFVHPHMHYRNALMAFTDFYYIDPNYRRGTTGIKLFRASERYLESMGVKKFFIQTEIHDGLDHSRIFEFLGYRFVEKTFAKAIGG